MVISANCVERKPAQAAEDSQRDTMHNTLRYTQYNTVNHKNNSVTQLQQPAIYSYNSKPWNKPCST